MKALRCDLIRGGERAGGLVRGWGEQALGYLVSKIQDGYGNERQGTNSVVTKRWDWSGSRAECVSRQAGVNKPCRDSGHEQAG